MQEAKKSYFGMQRRRATIEAVQYVRLGKVRHPLAPTKPLLRSNRAGTFTKPPLLQESRLTGGGSPNLVVLVEWKVLVERFMGAANCFH